MTLSKNYLPGETESRWYDHWLQQGYFHSEPDSREPYTVVIPPPNVTGVLHMGHTLNETVQDTLVRRARMHGYNVCWVPGADHASIATEAKVVGMLAEQGLKKADVGREAFLQHAYAWKDKYGGIIYEQIKRLGCSCDWDRATFTMDDHYYKAVIKVFVELYRKGLIYRGARMIHWDPVALTALSDEEVEYREVQSSLYYVQYALEGSGDHVTIATTRPETILGDTAICVHPDDERYRHLAGRSAIVPLIGRRIPIITDDYVDPSFGTGCLKVTPAHDVNDYALGLRHHLEVISVLNDDGTMSEAAQRYVGEDRFAARKLIVQDLKAAGHLLKTEDIINKNGFSQRTNAVVEPRISTQWFLQTETLAAPALDIVNRQDVRLFPEERFLNTYRHWMENIKDWCISRQLWWGQRIPAWYDKDGQVYVAESEEEARRMAAGAELHQDEDVLDTWFSSWLWPMEVFHGVTRPDNPDINYYYPTTVLVTGQDIIFFWVARMIMAGLAWQHERPFRDVYFTGMVRDRQGRKMSKSLGNSPDLLALIDQFGADAVRFGILISSPAGNDLLFDEAGCTQGRHFCNKLWNALKLVRGWTPEERPADDDFPARWFDSTLAEAAVHLDGLFATYRLSEALKFVYSLIWDDFCSWYLEWVKPPSGKTVPASVLETTLDFFERLLVLLHPFMPFVTEEIYHLLRDRKPGDDLVIRQAAAPGTPDPGVLAQGRLARQAITAIRDARNKQQIRHKDPIVLHIDTADAAAYQAFGGVLARQVNASGLQFGPAPAAGGIVVVVDKDKIVMELPHGAEAALSLQKDRLLQDLAHQRGFLASVEKKLGNERFVQHAKPELVERERQKQADAKARIQAIEESLKHM